jgi:hypothetical protein
MEKLSEEQMWEVIDGMASPEILQKHNQLLLADPEYKAEFQQYTFLEQQLLKLDLEVPSMRFTENVIDNALQIKKLDVKKDKSPAIYLAAMVMLSLLLVKLFSTVSESTNSPNPIENEGFMSILVNPFLINGFIVVNVILLFVLLDKKIAKPFFEKKLK